MLKKSFLTISMLSLMAVACNKEEAAAPAAEAPVAEAPAAEAPAATEAAPAATEAAPAQ